MRPHDQESPFGPPHEDRFVWPPVAPPPDHMAADATADASEPLPSEAAHSTVASMPLCVRLFTAVERAMARPTIEPIHRQITELGWRRDPADAYCNRCAHTIGPAEEDEFGCSRCRGSVLAYDRVIRLGEYTGPLDRWIWALKFQRLRTFGVHLGRELAKALREAGALQSLPPGGIAIQPMPTTTRRRISRAIDHASVLAEACAAALEVPQVRCLRRQHRPSQRSVSQSQRWDNARGSIWVPEGREQQLIGRRVIVVDDVMTSGATARASALALKGRPDARYAPAPWGAGEVWHCVIAKAE